MNQEKKQKKKVLLEPSLNYIQMLNAKIKM